MTRPAAAMTTAQWALLFLLSLLWGGSFFFAKVAVAELPPLLLVLARVSMAAAVLWLVVLVSRQPLPRGWRVPAALLAMGLVNNVIPFSLIFWSQTHISSGLAATLNAATPLFTALLAHAWGRQETLTAPRLAGVVVGLAGVALLVGPSAGGGLLAPLASLGATLSYAVAAVFGRTALRGVPPLVTATGQLTASSLLMAPLLLVLPLPATLSVPVMASVVALAVVSTAVAYLIYFRLLAGAGATNVQLVTLLIPVSAILLGTVILGEALTLHHLSGMAVIAAGLVLLDGRLMQRLRPRAA